MKRRIFRAPGRVNVIGEHTDYNEGFVLPFAIEQGTTVTAAERDDRLVHAHSLSLAASGEFNLDRPSVRKQGRERWLAYVEGVARALERRGARLRGCDLRIESDVPMGAGLSSSAALEVAVGLALAALSHASLGKLDIALAGQEAEHISVGLPSGIMDQYCSVFGRSGHALLLDCRSLQSEFVPLALKEVAFVLCDSGVKHQLASSEYAARRRECEDAVTLLQRSMPLISSLRDVSIEALEEYREQLPGVLFRRARHVISENQRVLAAVSALAAGDSLALGSLVNASHRSLRDDYEVSCKEIDALVEIAWRIDGVLGARMIGGGFGGSTLNLVHHAAVDFFKMQLPSAYKQASGLDARIFVVKAGNGATEIAGN